MVVDHTTTTFKCSRRIASVLCLASAVSATLPSGTWTNQAMQTNKTNPWMDRVRAEKGIVAAVDRIRNTFKLDNWDRVRWYREQKNNPQSITEIPWCLDKDVTERQARATREAIEALKAVLGDAVKFEETKNGVTQTNKDDPDGYVCTGVTTGKGSLVVRNGPKGDAEEGYECYNKSQIVGRSTSNGGVETSLASLVNLGGCGFFEKSSGGGEGFSEADLKESVKHELAHALGMKHEHQRMDAEENVGTWWTGAHIKTAITDLLTGPQKGPTLEADTLLPYDHDSIMHYNGLTPYAGVFGPKLTNSGFSKFDKLQLQRGYWYEVYKYDDQSKETTCADGYARQAWECVAVPKHPAGMPADYPGSPYDLTKDASCAKDYHLSTKKWCVYCPGHAAGDSLAGAPTTCKALEDPLYGKTYTYDATRGIQCAAGYARRDRMCAPKVGYLAGDAVDYARNSLPNEEYEDWWVPLVVVLSIIAVVAALALVFGGCCDASGQTNAHVVPDDVVGKDLMTEKTTTATTTTTTTAPLSSSSKDGSKQSPPVSQAAPVVHDDASVASGKDLLEKKTTATTTMLNQMSHEDGMKQRQPQVPERKQAPPGEEANSSLWSSTIFVGGASLGFVAIFVVGGVVARRGRIRRKRRKTQNRREGAP